MSKSKNTEIYDAKKFLREISNYEVARPVYVYRDDTKKLIKNFKSISSAAKYFLPYGSENKISSLSASIEKSRNYNPAKSKGTQKRGRFSVQIDGMEVICFATKIKIKKKK
ncbi:MAG: hypothetical protein ACPGTS_01575 [Minisyncoccia bacterium]